ncbi:F-box/kelch-repeat protein OR23 [Olea europaea var. sylvestris]|uniref:F-box/kelch-repeat protein OR23 n=1 Tax=Olea europaea var. sylvestris TaxID=158386 RepID=UPI000C1CEA48|nr:F-box/kelch-repeat protein OR23 [Olea europaea var. sylvestris]
MRPISSFEEVEIQTLTLTLIPGLPNDLGALILAFIPYSHHSRLKSTCKSWKRFFSSKTLISIRQNYVLPPHLLCIFPQDPSISSPYLFDPKNLCWFPLPPMPCNPHVYGLCNFISVSVGPHLYVLGGSLFDTRSFPLDRPSPSSSAFRFDFMTFSWDSLSPMITPRGSFACAALPDSNKIMVAGGGSRHTMFGAAGSRMSSVEMYDIGKDEWVALDGLPRFRAGCVGFFLGRREFWVMGGYGESRTVSGVFPVDEYYRDAVVMELKNGGKWRELGDMWEEGERRRLGKIVVVESERQDVPEIFMLDKSEISRYDMTSNRWIKETSVPKKASDDSSVGFVSLDGELHLLTLVNGNDSPESRRSRQHKRLATLLIQIYHPRKRTWRSLVTKPPFHHPIDFKTAVMCTIRL